METERTTRSSGATRNVIGVALLAVVGIAATAYLTYLNMQLDQEVSELRETQLGTQENALAIQEDLKARIDSLESDLADTVEERDDLSENLEREQERNEEFEDQIREIAGTVGQLDKLSKTDEELLEKYSKVYFLNEHYMPEELSEIDDAYVYNEERDFYLHSKVMPYFEEMVEDALDDDVNLWVVSAFRSFDEQTQLKEHYTVTYGTGANTFSADQGYSEHQLGTTVDFTTNGLDGGLRGFENTPAYEWLQEHAHEYGFTLSYPEGNAYYIFEPWHWRFVGVELAEDLNDEGDHFYDLSQRELDQYLISIFD